MKQSFDVPRLTRRAVIMGGAVLAAGCTPGRDLGAVPPYDPSVYRLGTDDQLRIVVYGEDPLSGDYRVTENGMISMPLTGSIPVSGLSTEQLAQRIATTLQDKQILSKPNISVEISVYRPIAVLGEVAKPGQLPYQPGMTMLTAVAAAGGFTYRGVQAYAYVIRQEADGPVTGRLKPQDYVKPGDVLKIYERYF